MALVVKNPAANAGDVKDVGSIQGSERSPGEGHGNPLQYSFLEKPVDRGAWRAGVAESDMTERLTLSLSSYSTVHLMLTVATAHPQTFPGPTEN